jgi:hypothetical protein
MTHDKTSSTSPPLDPDLARLIAAWPSLPPTVKRMILAALETSGSSTAEAVGLVRER